jgi:Ser-tRNA(Ala) deacylase AlaX
VYESEVAPTPKELQDIDTIANKLIQDDVPIMVTQMSRAEAEQKYSTSIYDFIKPPESLDVLNICEIEGWSVNAVKGLLLSLKFWL